jgi:hypothetical protein
MGPLSRRDTVGLAILAIGLAIGVTFLNPGSGEGAKDEPLHYGTTVPDVTPTVSPTPVPPPSPLAPPPDGWLLHYYNGAPAPENEDSTRVVPTLDLRFPNAPYPDMHDNNWSLVAEATYGLAPGRYVLKLEHQGDVRVTVDGGEFASQADTGAPQSLTVPINHLTSPISIRIEARDRAGVFSLRVE